MRSPGVARAWFAVTSLVVLVGIGIEVASAAGNEAGVFGSPAGRIFNVFCFFTIQSNIIVGWTSGLLARDLDRCSTVFRVFRITGVICIAITGVVFHLLLADLRVLTGWSVVSNQLLHTVSPIMGVVGWLAFGPRRLVDGDVVRWSTLFPIAWVVFTLVRGPIVDFYPYPFIDVIDLGYATVLRNVLGISIAYLALAFGAHLLDRQLPAGEREFTAPT